MKKVKLTVLKSNCRCNYLKEGQEFIVEDLCPPICHELWHMMYPYVCALQNGGDLDCGLTRKKQFKILCPDESRVEILGEVID